MPINGHTKSHHILTVFFSLPGTRKYQEFLQGTCSQTILKPSTHLAFERFRSMTKVPSPLHDPATQHCFCIRGQLPAAVTASPGCFSSSLCWPELTSPDNSEKFPQKPLTECCGSIPQLLSVIGAVPNAGVFTFA